MYFLISRMKVSTRKESQISSDLQKKQVVILEATFITANIKLSIIFKLLLSYYMQFLRLLIFSSAVKAKIPNIGTNSFE